ncbi:MAG: hypothetical protein JWM14_2265 [Chitinophagaceae bacterium]|nr:hypothetical protein [Chitinophagaceae bacterium]
MFKAPFSFNGRIERAEYILSFVIYIVILVTVSSFNEENPILGLIIIPFIWFLWAQGAKRCHDIDRSGWYQIIPFYFFVLAFTKGHPGRNRFDKDASSETIPDVLDTHE